jgi:hypothetical protein
MRPATGQPDRANAEIIFRRTAPVAGIAIGRRGDTYVMQANRNDLVRLGYPATRTPLSRGVNRPLGFADSICSSQAIYPVGKTVRDVGRTGTTRDYPVGRTG